MLLRSLDIFLIGLLTAVSAQNTTRPGGFNSTTPSTATTLVTLTTKPSSTQAATPTASPTTPAIGGIAAPPITTSADPKRPFEVNGNTFDSMMEAVMRACAIQNNKCADAVNSGQVTDAEVSDCEDQETVCVNSGVSK